MGTSAKASTATSGSPRVSVLGVTKAITIRSHPAQRSKNAVAPRSGGGRLRLAQVADQAAGDDDLALARKEVVCDDELFPCLGLDRDLVLALRDRGEARDAPGLAELGTVVVGLVAERQRDDPLCDQVA